MRLTKNEKRFSETDRPKVGQTITFSPALQLAHDYYKKIYKSFPNLNIASGQKCTCVDNLKYTTIVKFETNVDNLIVSPNFLITQELSVLGLKAKKVLDKFIRERSRKL